MHIRRFLQKILYKPIYKREFFEFEYGKTYFSQNGEDIIIDKLRPNIGFYIDVGAHKPIDKSNTYLLYSKGWRGINIEGDDLLFSDLCMHRTQDQNINKIVSNSSAPQTFLFFNEPAVNGLESTICSETTSRYKIIRKKTVLPTSLGKLLDNCEIPASGIDLLDVDCEGHDFNILQSNNWNKYIPKFILAENNAETDIIEVYLRDLNYILLITLGNTLLFKYKS